MSASTQPPISPRDDRALLDLAFRLASEAAEIVNTIRRQGFHTEFKSDASPVTEADRASERHILAGLRAACPTIPAIGEEETSSGIHVDAGDTCWLVDPLDGTRDFAAGGNNFTVNIGLVRGDRAVLGAVALPAYGQIYEGGERLGVRRHDAQGIHPIHTATPPEGGLRVLASRHYGDDDLLAKWLAGRPILSLEKIGSSVKFMRVAEGAADFYPRLGPTMEWDTAAPQAIIEAAGGTLHDAEGKPLRYGKPGRRNPSFYCSGGAS